MGEVWEGGPQYITWPEGCGPYCNRVAHASGFSPDRATEKFVQIQSPWLGKFGSDQSTDKAWKLEICVQQDIPGLHTMFTLRSLS